MGTLLAQIWGPWWHRCGDPGGAGMGILLAQIWGPWWHSCRDPDGIDMETLVAQIQECWWLSWWDSVGTHLGSLLAQIWGTWWDRCEYSDGTAGGTLVARLWGHRWPSRSSPPLQKHNFPIDYTLRVQHEEVLRTANVTRLVSSPGTLSDIGGAGRGGGGLRPRGSHPPPPPPLVPQRDGKVSEASLRYLWFHACSQAVLHILEVLPEKHPSRGYTQELSQLLDALGVEYSGYRQVGLPHCGGDGVGRGMWVGLTPHSPAVGAAPDVGPWGSAGGEPHMWHWWFSGRILACHAGGPGSIPGQCNRNFFLSLNFFLPSL